MRILIFGAGAVGQGIGCFLADAGHAVDLVLRERFAGRIRTGGLRVTGIFGDRGVPSGGIGVSISVDGWKGRQYDYALVTTKSFDTASACSELLRLEQIPGAVVSMQNGCGNLEQVAEAFGDVLTVTGGGVRDPQQSFCCKWFCRNSAKTIRGKLERKYMAQRRYFVR